MSTIYKVKMLVKTFNSVAKAVGYGDTPEEAEKDGLSRIENVSVILKRITTTLEV